MSLLLLNCQEFSTLLRGTNKQNKNKGYFQPIKLKMPSGPILKKS